MNRRKLLVLSVSILATLGVLVAFLPFALSLAPSDGAGEDLPRIDVSELLPGGFMTQNFPESGRAEARFYVLKDFDSSIYLYRVYLRENQVQLPNYNWWNWGPVCTNFGPELDNGNLKRDGVIKCHDEPELTASSWWIWAYDGTNISGERPNMEAPKFSLIGPHLVVGR